MNEESKNIFTTIINSGCFRSCSNRIFHLPSLHDLSPHERFITLSSIKALGKLLRGAYCRCKNQINCSENRGNILLFLVAVGLVGALFRTPPPPPSDHPIFFPTHDPEPNHFSKNRARTNAVSTIAKFQPHVCTDKENILLLVSFFSSNFVLPSLPFDTRPVPLFRTKRIIKSYQTTF